MPYSPANKQAANKARYQTYKETCSRFGVQPEWDRWWKHYLELRARTDNPVPRPSVIPEAVSTERRLTRAEHYAYWTERFSAKEIREVGSALDFLTDDQVAA